MAEDTRSEVKLQFVVNHGLPKLAWVADVDLVTLQTTVTHGPWVEVFERGFVEGVWDGPFADAAFDRTPCVFGSGGVVRGCSMIFASSASTTDYLYWMTASAGSRVTVANSLPLLLARCDDELDPQFHGYDLINASIMSGISRYIREIPTRKGDTVRRLMHWNLIVAPGQVVESDKPWPPDFVAFSDYAAYLAQSYQRLARNARDSNRSRPMAIFSTQSRGYDTTAANAVAKDHGIDKVFTVPRGKAKGYYADEGRRAEPDDDGTEICGFFGLECIPIERRAIERDPRSEYLFYASMHENGDFNLHEISAHVVNPTVLITGCLGEIWYPKTYYAERPGLINPDLMRVDLGNHGLTEVRLEVGYVQLAFPYIGARRRESVYRITHSEEMGPWRLNAEYDRPIPRRLAEQTGLPRTAFGQTKMASVLEFPFPIVPVGESLRREFLAFLVNSQVLRSWETRLLPLARRWNSLVWNTSPRRHAWNYYLQRIISRLVRKPFALPFVWTRLNGAIFCFCANRRIEDYRFALRAPSGQRAETHGPAVVGPAPGR